MVKNIFVIFLYFFWSLGALTTKSMFLARNHSHKPRFCSHHTIRPKYQRKTKNYKRNAIRSFGYFILRLVRVLYYNTSYERAKKGVSKRLLDTPFAEKFVSGSRCAIISTKRNYGLQALDIYRCRRAVQVPLHRI